MLCFLGVMGLLGPFAHLCPLRRGAFYHSYGNVVPTVVGDGCVFLGFLVFKSLEEVDTFCSSLLYPLVMLLASSAVGLFAGGIF